MSESMHALAKKQLEEHKEWMRITVRKHMSAVGQQKQLILSWIDEVSLSVVGKERMKNELGQETVSVTYIYPDELFEFLQNPDSPQQLRLALVGGRVIGKDYVSE